MFRAVPLLRFAVGAKSALLLASKRDAAQKTKSKVIQAPSFGSDVVPMATASAMALASQDMDVSTPISKDAKKKMNLSDFHPGIASTWVTSTANKLLQPQHVLPSSRKLVWWQCPACKSQFTKRIDLHVAAGGECPSCHYVPPTTSPVSAPVTAKMSKKQAKAMLRGEKLDEALANGSLGGAAFPSVAHRARTHSTQGALAAENENRIKKSVADNGYLRVGDTRNLQPMLAKNYLDVMDKIGATEQLYVSPKLDGVRCIAAYDAKNNQALFFSRAGTLFECCDLAIEPALRVLFQTDPTLVLDGELYNHSETNNFEQLISAIRTTREKRTKNISALQKKLEYHVFDVLYSKRLQDEMSTTDSQDVVLDSGHASPSKGRATSKKAAKARKAASSSTTESSSNELTCPFSVRYQFLEDCVAFTDATNGDESPIKLVRAHRANMEELEKFLHKYIDKGYEGIMVRRDNDGGYAYGSRSSNLLKYKLMQDDEFVIVGAVEGKGKLKNSLGAFVCETKKGEKFTVSPATTQQNRGKIWKNWSKYKGKVLTVQFQQLSSSGIPRFPIGKCVRGSSNGSDWL